MYLHRFVCGCSLLMHYHHHHHQQHDHKVLTIQLYLRLSGFPSRKGLLGGLEVSGLRHLQRTRSVDAIFGLRRGSDRCSRWPLRPLCWFWQFCVGLVAEGGERRFHPMDSSTAASAAVAVQHCCVFGRRIWWFCAFGACLVVMGGPLRRLWQ